MNLIVFYNKIGISKSMIKISYFFLILFYLHLFQTSKCSNTSILLFVLRENCSLFPCSWRSYEYDHANKQRQDKAPNSKNKINTAGVDLPSVLSFVDEGQIRVVL